MAGNKSDLDRPYELWHPAPGQRVRVRRSGECRSAHHIANGSEDGCPGTVIMCDYRHTDHPYFVLFDAPISTGLEWPSGIIGQYYAAEELEAEDA